MKRALRIGSFVLLGFVILLVTVFVLFRLNKGWIEGELLRIAQTYQSGEITVEDLDLSLFAHFPKVAFKLDNVTYFEHPALERAAGEQPVAELEHVIVAVEVLKLLKGDIVVTELTLKNGGINLIKYPDRSINLLNAAGIDPGESKGAKRSSARDSGGIIELEEVTLQNVHLGYDNTAEDYRLDLLIHHLKNSVSIGKPFLDFKMTPEMRLLGITIKGREWLKDIDLGMEVEFRFNMEDLTGQIAPSRLQVENAFVRLEGSFDISEDEFLDLKFDSLINDASLLSLVFGEELIFRNKANLKKGGVFLNGTVKGPFRDHLPLVEVTFGADDIHLDIPEGGGPIQALGFRGYFTTGMAQDLSEGIFRIKDLSAVLPGGFLNGSAEVNNFKRPELSLHCDAQADIRGFDRILRINSLKDLTGILTFNADVQGTMDIEKTQVLNQEVKAGLIFQDVAFFLPDWRQSIDRLNGAADIDQNSLRLRDVSVKTGGSDLLLNGDISGVLAYLQDRQTEIKADLRITSDMLKLADVQALASRSAAFRDEEVRGLEAHLFFTSTSEALSDFSLIPRGSLTINGLSAGLTNFADIKTLTGTVDVNRDAVTVTDLQAEIGASDIRMSAELTNPRGLASKDIPVEMKLTFVLDSRLLQVDDIFTYRERTYAPFPPAAGPFRNVHLQGELRTNNQELFAGKKVPDFHLRINEVDWSLAAFPNPFEDLAADVSFQNEDLVIRNIQGQFGENDFSLGGVVEDILHKGRESDPGISTTLHLHSDHLDLGDLDELVVSPTQEKKELVSKSWDFPPVHLSLDIDSMVWGVIAAEMVTGEIHTRGITQLVLHSQDESVPMLTTDVNGSLSTESLSLSDLEIPEFSMRFAGQNRMYDIEPSLETVFGTRGTGQIHLDFSRPVRAFRIQYQVENFFMERLLRRFAAAPSMTGRMDFQIDLSAFGNDAAALNRSLTGRVVLYGYELTLHGIDVDDLLAKFKRSQKFNLVDLGAFMMAGPVGAVLTKGYDFASLLELDPNAKSEIPRFISQWNVVNGVAEAEDVALITNKSRVALRGGIDFVRKQFREFSLAVVDSKGCALVSQSLDGPFENPQMSGISAVEALLAPIFNIFKIVVQGNCPPFYTGSLPHPSR